KRIGMLPKLQASNFIRKYSVQFVSASGRESQPFYFDEMNPHECSQTWQVVRSEFDRMMLDNAAEHGATVWQETNVVDVLFEPAPSGNGNGNGNGHGHGPQLPRATGVIVQRRGEPPRRITAKVV